MRRLRKRQVGNLPLIRKPLELSVNGQITKHLIYELPAGTDKVVMIDGLTCPRPYRRSLRLRGHL